MDEIITYVKGIELFGLTWIPVFIILAAAALSLLSLIFGLIKRSIYIILLIVGLNVLASYGVFEYINKIIEK